MLPRPLQVMIPSSLHAFFLVLVAIGCLAILSRTARAQDSPRIQYRLTPAVDIPVIAISGTTWLAFPIAHNFLDYDFCGAGCDRATLNALDRPVVDYREVELRSAANAMVGGVCGVAGLSLLMGMGSKPVKEVLSEILILAEAAAITGAVTEIVKHGSQRPRPYMYDGEAGEPLRRNNAKDYTSFFSGHTATAFAVAAGFSRIFHKTNPNSKVVWLVYAFSFSAATLVGLFRVGSGDHFWTDVITGAFVGTAVGFAVPALHETSPREDGDRFRATLTLSPGGLELVGSF